MPYNEQTLAETIRLLEQEWHGVRAATGEWPAPTFWDFITKKRSIKPQTLSALGYSRERLG